MQLTKTCCKCKIEKSIDDFNKSKSHGGYYPKCKECRGLYYKNTKDIHLVYAKKYQKNNYNKILKYNNKWRKKNAAKYKNCQKKSREKNKQHYLDYKKWYNLTHKEEIRDKHNQRMHSNVNLRVLHSMRSRLGQVIKGYVKSASTMKLVGCTLEELIKHIESLFQPGMSWENYGNKPGQWSIDHITPCVAFDFSDPVEQKQCFHYTNLRPMWHIDNIKKGDKIIV